jgi:hypothetical protein
MGVIVFVHKAHESLLPWCGPHVGRLLSPRQYSRADDTAEAGIPWAADNDCFQALGETPYQRMLRLLSYRRMLKSLTGLSGCKFVVAQDVVGDWKATREAFDQWHPEVAATRLPIAYVIQDGQPVADVPWRQIDALFVGGSTEFKCSDQAHDLVRAAQWRHMWTHMGRVNTARRMTLAKSWGCDSVDGTSVSMFTDIRLPERLAQAAAPKQLNIREAMCDA